MASQKSSGLMRFSVQHLGSTLFQGILYTKVALEKLLRQGDIVISGVRVPLEPLVSRFIRVACMFLPDFIPDEYLLRALAPYGTVKSLHNAFSKDRSCVRNGHRIVQMEMNVKKPVPNFLRVMGYRVTCRLSRGPSSV